MTRSRVTVLVVVAAAAGFVAALLAMRITVAADDWPRTDESFQSVGAAQPGGLVSHISEFGDGEIVYMARRPLLGGSAEWVPRYTIPGCSDPGRWIPFSHGFHPLAACFGVGGLPIPEGTPFGWYRLGSSVFQVTDRF